MKYLKQFNTHSNYETFIDSSNFITPNVSLCVQQNEVHYNPIQPETKLAVYYNIQDTSNPTTVCTNYENSIKSMEVDGVILDNVVTEYTFDTVGEHIIRYEFNNPTTVGGNAPLFMNVTSAKRVVIGDDFTTIGRIAFNQCSGLEDVIISNNVTSIDYQAFIMCSNLRNCKIGNSVITIGESAFAQCTSLTSIVIPDSVTSIGNSAFNLCSDLTSCTIGNGVTSIGDRAFNSCSSLMSIVIPDNVTNIGNSAFTECTSITSCTIGSNVTSIGTFAFAGLSGITSITSNATTAPTIQSNTFQNIKTNGTLTVPAGSTGYDVWMNTGDNYLGKYNWTKVEQ